MPTYSAPVRDYQFVLHEMLHLDRYANLPGFADATPDLIDAIIEEGGKFVSEVIQPLNQVGDSEGCTWNDGEVTTPTTSGRYGSGRLRSSANRPSAVSFLRRSSRRAMSAPTPAGSMLSTTSW